MSVRALPSWLVAACAVLVALALVGFAVSGTTGPGAGTAGPAATPQPTTAPEPREHTAGSSNHRQHDPRRHHARQHRRVERRTAYVEVYNNSGLTGLASDTASVLSASGWRIVATDNWYGEIPANTIYYPDDLQAQARLLARDLGVPRLHPAVSPMSFDRLTVILTSAP